MSPNETEDYKIDHVELQEKIRAQLKPQLPKRFYNQVAITEGQGVFNILLDQRPVRSPGKNLLTLPNRSLAEAVSAEWQAQSEVINPALMPLTRLANTAIDRIKPDSSNALSEIMPYAGADLLCYRAAAPASLLQLQEKLWTPYLVLAQENLGADFITTKAVSHVDQPRAAIDALAAWLNRLGAYQLAAVHMLTGLTGSVLLAFAASETKATPEKIFQAAHVDETWQSSQWGEDGEAAERLVARRGEIEAACRFLDLLDT